ncbi:unnamed protein product [Tilletia controversa]|nr:unnamed protein product [Tilletia controversa]
MNPIPTLGRWDRLESLQLLGPRFRLTCSSARTLGLGLPRLKRLALVMPNIMPPSRSTPEGEDANTTDEDEGDDPEEVGRDLFLRMSPLQVLIDTLCPSDSILPPKDSHTSSTEEKPSSPIFEHLLIVGHDLPIYVGSSTKLRRWIEGLQYRVRRRTPSPADHDRRYYLDPDSRFGDSSTGANGWEEEEEVQQPQIQLLTARLSPNEDAADDALPPHPLQIARWMLRRTRTQTHWTFGPDHPSRASNVCLRPPVQLNANDAVEHDAPDFDGDEDGYDDQGLEMELAAADEVVFVDDEREGVKYTLENFELPITFLSPYPSRTGASNEQDQEYSSDVRSTDEPGASSAYNGTTPSPHTFLPHSSGPSSSSTQRPENISVSSDAAPDLEYVDAALRQQKAVRIETIHPGTSHPHGSSSSSSSREQKQKRSNGAAGSLASWLTGGWR